MLPFFDAGLLVHDDLPGGLPLLPDGFAGALLFGPRAKSCRDELYRWHPDRLWRHAEALDRVVGEKNARFPSRMAAVVDLELDRLSMNDWLKHPAEWWPLCESLRGSTRLLRLRLSAGLSELVSTKHLIKRFSSTRFLLDPFVHGPVPGWQGFVRLAEASNVTLTTRGLFPAPGAPWSENAANEALRFVAGEVGAAMLLYASGLPWEEVGSPEAALGRQWLSATPSLDVEERTLVLSENGQAVFTGGEEMLPGL